jgi:hypothetical protein
LRTGPFSPRRRCVQSGAPAHTQGQAHSGDTPSCLPSGSISHRPPATPLGASRSPARRASLLKRRDWRPTLPSGQRTPAPTLNICRQLINIAAICLGASCVCVRSLEVRRLKFATSRTAAAPPVSCVLVRVFRPAEIDVGRHVRAGRRITSHLLQYVAPESCSVLFGVATFECALAGSVGSGRAGRYFVWRTGAAAAAKAARKAAKTVLLAGLFEARVFGVCPNKASVCQPAPLLQDEIRYRAACTARSERGSDCSRTLEARPDRGAPAHWRPAPNKIWPTTVCLNQTGAVAFMAPAARLAGRPSQRFASAPRAPSRPAGVPQLFQFVASSALVRVVLVTAAPDSHVERLVE